MNKLDRYHQLYMDIALRVAKMSHCVRLQVGAVAVRDDRILSMGWNGTPAGFDNVCEDANNVTLDIVLHAESNLLMKIAKSHDSSKDVTIYLTHAPCIHCAKMIHQAEVAEIIFQTEYRGKEGIAFLQQNNIKITKL